MVNRPGNKRKRDSRDRMCRALVQLAQEKKPGDISVSELCALAGVNRTTFYNNYDNMAGLAEDVKNRIVMEHASMYEGDNNGHTPENYLKMFQHIKENQIFYRTYFLLGPDSRWLYENYDKKMARELGRTKNVEYSVEFFAAGITAMIKKWLENNCRESPEEMLDILKAEYGRR